MPPERHGTHVVAYVWLLVVLLAVVAALYIFRIGGSIPDQSAEIDSLESLVAQPPEPVATDLVIAQKGFDYLVSYTGGAFLPASFQAAEGETIRFVNNDSEIVQVTVAGEVSPALARGQYWEFTVPATTTAQLSYEAGGITGELTIQ